MRGPSSSHCAAAVRIGRLARDLMGGEIQEVLIEFHPDGSLATTHESQGSDMGLFGGLLGWDAADERLVNSAEAMLEAGIETEVRITEFPAYHPNTYRLTLKGPGLEHRMVAVSTGGGIIRVDEIDGFPVSMAGDFHETLVFLAGVKEGEDGGPDQTEDVFAHLVECLEADLEAEEVHLHRSEAGGILQIKSGSFPSTKSLRKSLDEIGVSEVRFLAPVLPVQSRSGMKVPFLRADGIPKDSDRDNTSLWELAVDYESARGSMSAEEVLRRMEDILRIMEQSVDEGLAGTAFQDRILPPQTGRYDQRLRAGELLDVGILNRIILYTSAIMEVKSSMGVVVAAPTAGSCGALPATVVGAGHEAEASTEEMAKAMLAAGLVGVFITAGSTFAAEVCGCQAECGAGSAMAAAALVTLRNGSTAQALAAASMALQNTLGMICDPVANRVEVPCLGRNVLAASNAVGCANMALAGFDEVIPLDEVIATMDDVGKAMPHELRCTALGGLSVTATSKRIQRELEGTNRTGV
ncbi:MAG: L-serine ammonia-lyase, iron-sulfur-dependent, subunit alpha [Gemmatimonadetes bacterium]|nr:L-serine ammonia-lyase, iron-sulfur-dependent, subunit alpha [Gemmatimonadota bacterium]